MKTYYVERAEVYKQTIKVEANSVEEAISLVADDGGEIVGELEYSHTLDVDTWNVFEDKS